MCKVNPVQESFKPGSALISSFDASLTAATEEPRSKDRPAEQGAAEEASKPDHIPASSSAAAETKSSNVNDEIDDREPAESRQEPAESHKLKNLWDEAYDRLREDGPELIDAYEKDLLASGSVASVKARAQPSVNGARGEDREGQLEKLVKDKLDAIQNAQLTVTVGGEKIVVKDQVCKLVRKILSFTDFIGAAITTEPHAALAWAGVVIILPVCVAPDVFPFS